MEAINRHLKPISRQEFYRRLSSLSARHRRLLREHLGTPPDPKNIPEEVWERIEKENAALLILLAAAAALTLVRTETNAMQNTTGQTLSREAMAEILARSAGRRAGRVARWTTDTTRRWLQEEFDDDPDRSPRGGVQSVLSKDRIVTIAGNEFIAARSVAAEAMRTAAKKVGVAVTQIWELGPCNHCEVCPLLHGTPDEFWRQFTNGPPLHPNCCCNIRTVYQSLDELKAARLVMATYPDPATVRAAIRKHGFRAK